MGGAARSIAYAWWRQAGGDGSRAEDAPCRISIAFPTAWSSCWKSWARTVVPSGPLVTRFASVWSADDLADHRGGGRDARPGGTAGVAPRGEIGRDVASPRAPSSRKSSPQSTQAGLVFDHPPIVGFGPNAANPHYEPRPARTGRWQTTRWCCSISGAGGASGRCFADQTWMGFSGERPAGRRREGVGDGARRAGCGDRVRAGRLGDRPADPGVRGGPCDDAMSLRRRVWRVVRASDRSLDRPPPARLRAASR